MYISYVLLWIYPPTFKIWSDHVGRLQIERYKEKQLVALKRMNSCKKAARDFELLILYISGNNKI